MNAWSIGFIPVDYEMNDEGGRKFTKWELLEFSAVLVPDNPEALTILRSKGVNEELIRKGIDDAQNMTEQKVETIEAELKIVDLTVSQFKALLHETKEITPTIEKEGRAINGKHEALLNECMDLHTKCMQNIKMILASVGGDHADDAPEDEKAIASHPLVKKLQRELKTSDKSIGLTLRLLKTITSV